MSAYDIEQWLEQLGIESAGPPANPKCYARHELARKLFDRINDKLKLWNHPTKPSDVDDVIIGNG